MSFCLRISFPLLRKRWWEALWLYTRVLKNNPRRAPTPRRTESIWPEFVLGKGLQTSGLKNLHCQRTRERFHACEKNMLSRRQTEKPKFLRTAPLLLNVMCTARCNKKRSYRSRGCKRICELVTAMTPLQCDGAQWIESITEIEYDVFY